MKNECPLRRHGPGCCGAPQDNLHAQHGQGKSKMSACYRGS